MGQFCWYDANKIGQNSDRKEDRYLLKGNCRRDTIYYCDPKEYRDKKNLVPKKTTCADHNICFKNGHTTAICNSGPTKVTKLHDSLCNNHIGIYCGHTANRLINGQITLKGNCLSNTLYYCDQFAQFGPALYNQTCTNNNNNNNNNNNSCYQHMSGGSCDRNSGKVGTLRVSKFV
ncbi:uncharacterized protein LOC128951614 [Oppia nitens]|uniref:uncharacterized protein LOC128951614 n=1 Tax=Oppia nitens TaxID=1686743 RepID=UPI0023DCCE65|nr:uncharacterized protein LOC128951614 [Oppia nitens]